MNPLGLSTSETEDTSVRRDTSTLLNGGVGADIPSNVNISTPEPAEAKGAEISKELPSNPKSTSFSSRPLKFRNPALDGKNNGLLHDEQLSLMDAPQASSAFPLPFTSTGEYEANDVKPTGDLPTAAEANCPFNPRIPVPAAPYCYRIHGLGGGRDDEGNQENEEENSWAKCGSFRIRHKRTKSQKTPDAHAAALRSRGETSRSPVPAKSGRTWAFSSPSQGQKSSVVRHSNASDSVAAEKGSGLGDDSLGDKRESFEKEMCKEEKNHMKDKMKSISGTSHSLSRGNNENPMDTVAGERPGYAACVSTADQRIKDNENQSFGDRENTLSNEIVSTNQSQNAFRDSQSLDRFNTQDSSTLPDKKNGQSSDKGNGGLEQDISENNNEKGFTSFPIPDSTEPTQKDLKAGASTRNKEQGGLNSIDSNSIGLHNQYGENESRKMRGIFLLNDYGFTRESASSLAGCGRTNIGAGRILRPASSVPLGPAGDMTGASRYPNSQFFRPSSAFPPHRPAEARFGGSSYTSATMTQDNVRALLTAVDASAAAKRCTHSPFDEMWGKFYEKIAPRRSYRIIRAATPQPSKVSCKILRPAEQIPEKEPSAPSLHEKISPSCSTEKDESNNYVVVNPHPSEGSEDAYENETPSLVLQTAEDEPKEQQGDVDVPPVRGPESENGVAAVALLSAASAQHEEQREEIGCDISELCLSVSTDHARCLEVPSSHSSKLGTSTLIDEDGDPLSGGSTNLSTSSLEIKDGYRRRVKKSLPNSSTLPLDLHPIFGDFHDVKSFLPPKNHDNDGVKRGVKLSCCTHEKGAIGSQSSVSIIHEVDCHLPRDYEDPDGKSPLGGAENGSSFFLSDRCEEEIEEGDWCNEMDSDKPQVVTYVSKASSANPSTEANLFPAMPVCVADEENAFAKPLLLLEKGSDKASQTDAQPSTGKWPPATMERETCLTAHNNCCGSLHIMSRILSLLHNEEDLMSREARRSPFTMETALGDPKQEKVSVSSQTDFYGPRAREEPRCTNSVSSHAIGNEDGVKRGSRSGRSLTAYIQGGSTTKDRLVFIPAKTTGHSSPESSPKKKKNILHLHLKLSKKKHSPLPEKVEVVLDAPCFSLKSMAVPVEQRVYSSSTPSDTPNTKKEGEKRSSSIPSGLQNLYSECDGSSPEPLDAIPRPFAEFLDGRPTTPVSGVRPRILDAERASGSAVARSKQRRHQQLRNILHRPIGVQQAPSLVEEATVQSALNAASHFPDKEIETLNLSEEDQLIILRAARQLCREGNHAAKFRRIMLCENCQWERRIGSRSANDRQAGGCRKKQRRRSKKRKNSSATSHYCRCCCGSRSSSSSSGSLVSLNEYNCDKGCVSNAKKGHRSPLKGSTLNHAPAQHSSSGRPPSIIIRVEADRLSLSNSPAMPGSAKGNAFTSSMLNESVEGESKGGQLNISTDFQSGSLDKSTDAVRRSVLGECHVVPPGQRLLDALHREECIRNHKTLADYHWTLMPSPSQSMCATSAHLSETPILLEERDDSKVEGTTGCNLNSQAPLVNAGQRSTSEKSFISEKEATLCPPSTGSPSRKSSLYDEKDPLTPEGASEEPIPLDGSPLLISKKKIEFSAEVLEEDAHEIPIKDKLSVAEKEKTCVEKNDDALLIQPETPPISEFRRSKERKTEAQVTKSVSNKSSDSLVSGFDSLEAIHSRANEKKAVQQDEQKSSLNNLREKVEKCSKKAVSDTHPFSTADGIYVTGPAPSEQKVLVDPIQKVEQNQGLVESGEASEEAESFLPIMQEDAASLPLPYKQQAGSHETPRAPLFTPLQKSNTSSSHSPSIHVNSRATASYTLFQPKTRFMGPFKPPSYSPKSNASRDTTDGICKKEKPQSHSSDSYYTILQEMWKRSGEMEMAALRHLPYQGGSSEAISAQKIAAAKFQERFMLQHSSPLYCSPNVSGSYSSGNDEKEPSDAKKQPKEEKN